MYKIYIRKPGIGIFCFHKFLLVMKLTTIILIAAVVQVSAASYAQKVTLEKKSASLESVFKELRKQTGYDFFFDRNSMLKASPVTISVQNAELKDVLEQLFAHQQLSYSIESNTVIVKEKTPSFLDKIINSFTVIDLRGRILDDKGTPLPGATVKIKGTNIIALANINGEFRINNVSEGAILVINYIGYNSVSLPAKRDMGNITLMVSTSQLDQVQVIAYGTSTKRANTGSQAGIKAADIEKQVVNNPIEALIGRITGLEVTQQSGMAGTAFTIRIRGLNSLRQNANEPLVLIDGIPFQTTSLLTPASIATVKEMSPLSSLNAADIESIDVLKDADATAIYGSRGANGVILITTKKGKAGKTAVNFNISSGAGKIARKANVLNLREYLDMRYETFRNDGADFEKSAYAWDLNDWDTTRNTDWQDKLLGGTARFSNMQVSMTGGDERTNYNFGAGYLRQTSVYPIKYADQKYNGRLAINHTATNQKFKVQFLATYGSEDNRLPAVDLVSAALTLSPNAPDLYDAQGKLNWDNSRLLWENPMAKLQQTTHSKTNTFTSNATVSYELPKGIALKTLFGFNNNNNNALDLQPSTVFNPSQAASLAEFYRKSNNTITNTSTWNIEPQLTYTTKVGPGIINVLAGATFQRTRTNALTNTGYGYKDDDLLSNLSAASRITGSRTLSEYNYNAIFSRIGYNIANRYILNFTGRRDGSSRFARGKQFGNFGAVGAAWLFAEESWIKNSLPFLSYGKLRGSYGITGNDMIGDYAYFQLYNSTNLRYGPAGYGGDGVLTPDKLENDKFGWETNKKAEAALELGFFKDRILFSTNYYHNRSSNMLVDYPLAATTGFTGIISNLPALIQNSGWEFELNTVNLKSKNFTWSSSFNLTLPKNKLVRFDGIENSSYKDTYVVGHPLSMVKTVLPYDVNPQTGVREFKNAQGMVISPYELTLKDVVNIVDLFKDYYGGLNNSFSYKGFSLDVFLQFSKQRGNYTTSTAFRSNQFSLPGFIGNMASDKYANRWTTPGQTGAMFQRLTQDLTFAQPAAIAAQLQPSLDPAYYLDISYLRLKNVSLSYTLPSSFQKKLRLQNARIFIQGQNLLTFTNYPGMDPENQSGGLPPLKILTAGLQLTF
ncbi:SusC/RagA family TonB-linked outer membrane protein [Pedobacter hiemivivus]|uniref:SusC/RagA family TonB-linked outer membrane protein n=1 Tax=Pedobacter hiemivivus TaxID=2530454 RepID=A0A4R0NFP9_9SPHI|nr:SusC/RagA family TonB-linked outer membrane protein [Pedobacter hiemivivus]TCC98567.1 SusC/RagA family TonB-linked outer membrane protein [Pedobacter hiemivivus]